MPARTELQRIRTSRVWDSSLMAARFKMLLVSLVKWPHERYTSQPPKHVCDAEH